MNISVVTSFNERISRNPKTQILDSFGKLGNNVDISLYHENSYDLKRFGKIIDLSKLDDTVHPVDIFTCWSKFQDLEEGWLEEFVAATFRNQYLALMFQLFTLDLSKGELAPATNSSNHPSSKS